MVQLGSERNFDFSELKGRIVTELLARDVQVVEVLDSAGFAVGCASPWNAAQEDISDCGVPRRVDLMVVNAGYNTFHECIHGGVPSIFVPNEARELDDQHVRAAIRAKFGPGALSENIGVELRGKYGRVCFVQRLSHRASPPYGAAGVPESGRHRGGRDRGIRVFSKDLTGRYRFFYRKGLTSQALRNLRLLSQKFVEVRGQRHLPLDLPIFKDQCPAPVDVAPVLSGRQHGT